MGRFANAVATLAMPCFWDFDAFSSVPLMRARYASADKRITDYPVKYLRYWIARSLIEQEAATLGRRLRVLEVGVDRGQMLTFMHDVGADGTQVRSGAIERWDAMSARIDAAALAKVGYDGWIEADVDHGRVPAVDSRYDVIVLLHILEHLYEPEETLEAFGGLLAPAGVILGGAPTMPHLLGLIHEPRLARRSPKFGHVSVISPERIEMFARRRAFDLDFLSGAFFLRMTGHAIEDSPLWLRLNLLFGYLFPSLGSELYFRLRRGPAVAPSAVARMPGPPGPAGDGGGS